MWRRVNKAVTIPHPDSDQSISEEDEELVNVNLKDNDTWPNENPKEDEGLLLQTKLEKLIGCGVETGSVSPDATLEKIVDSFEDDVEVPDSLEEESKDELTCVYASDDEIPQDVEVNDSLEESYSVTERKDELTCVYASDDEIPRNERVASWSTISKEAESLLHLNGVVSVSSPHSVKRGGKVVKDHGRPKFSFHSHGHGETSSKICDMAEHLEPAADMVIEEDPIADCPNSFDEISENRQGITDMDIEVRDGCIEEPISKLVDIPTDKIRVAKRSSKPYCRRKGRSLKFAHKGSSSILQDSSATDDELPGPMDSGSSTDDEASSVPTISNQKKQFVGDRFDEAIKASSLSKEGLLFTSPKLSGGSSLYGKLQQIMKQEKETEMEITKKLQGGNEQADGSSYVDVRILSRYLEAKLIVCKCSIIDLSRASLLFKNAQALADKESQTTIIFSPKVCADVDIEIGSFIRLYAPWKEREVKNTNEVIILCSYFSSM